MVLKGLNFIAKLRERESSADDLLLLSILAVVCGVISGLTMILIVAGLRFFSGVLLPGHSENYEGLDGWLPFIFPLVATSLLALIWFFLPAKWQKVGIPYVVERLNYHHGNLPMANGVVQLVGVFIGLLGGLSIGKEGPAVHIGATFGSQLAQRFRLTHIGIETLVACGVAGAIAAAFQTPIAGVLFAFEVIFLEYRLRHGIPVMLSAVVAVMLSEATLGSLDLFTVTHFNLAVPTHTLLPSLLVLVVGIVLATSMFYRLQRLGWRMLGLPIWVRFTAVGLATGLVAMFLPSVLGGGYDTLNRIFMQQAPDWLLLLIVAKIVLTGLSIGLGIPGGMIGPAFVIGGLVGMQVGLLFHGVLPDIAVYGLFPLLGMASMMAATFQAPLTALIAVLEMTHSSQAMLPSLVVITLSCLITRLVLHQDSVFVERLHAMGMVSSWDPVQKLLRHSDLRSLCESVVQLPRLAPPERLREINASMIDFVLIEHLGQTSVTGREELLSVFEQWRLGPQPWLSNDDQEVQLDLARMGSWQSVLVVPAPDTPAEALALMNRHHCDRLVLQFEQGLGLVSRYQIDKLLLKD